MENPKPGMYNRGSKSAIAEWLLIKLIKGLKQRKKGYLMKKNKNMSKKANLPEMMGKNILSVRILWILWMNLIRNIKRNKYLIINQVISL